MKGINWKHIREEQPKDGEGLYLKDCCKKIYDELRPDFEGPYRRKCIKPDGSICEKHQAIEDGVANK